ncbi:MAG: DNA/RNA non-specific endonuclease [Bdellovibrionota bacterium]
MVFILAGLLGGVGIKPAQGATFPKSGCDQVLYKKLYTVCYSKKHRQAFWTSHDLTLESISGTAQRTDRFKADPDLDDPVLPTDYTRSGYDRGHLVPAGDMKLNGQAMADSFFMSNMSPQVPQMNRGLWSSLENTLRKWVKQFGDAWVITAPVLYKGLQKLPSGVSIPTQYYKIVYVPSQKMMAAFLVPNINTTGHNFWDYVTSVDKIEVLTGFDFYHELDDALEKKLEKQVAAPSKWSIY